MGVKRFLAVLLGALVMMWSATLLKALEEQEVRHLATTIRSDILDGVDSNTTSEEMIRLLGEPTTYIGSYRPTNPQDKCEYCWWENEKRQVIKMVFLDGKLFSAYAMGFPGGYKEKRTDAVQSVRP